jgi:hypothetical protein
MKNIFILFIALILVSCATKKQTKITQETKNKIVFNNKHHSNSKVLYILDGKKISDKSLKKINSKRIKSVSIIKSKKEVAKYTKKKIDGVIIITTKKN